MKFLQISPLKQFQNDNCISLFIMNNETNAILFRREISWNFLCRGGRTVVTCDPSTQALRAE
jgi:hypothetical protein